MKRFLMAASTGMFVFLASDLVDAQQPTQAQPGQVQSGQPTPAFQGPIIQTPWFANPAVRQELRFSDDQFNRLNKVYGDAWSQYQKGVNSFGNTLTPAQQVQRQQELQQQFYKSVYGPTNEIIPNPQALARFNQLYLQYRGPDAFNDPSVQQMLKFSDSQRQQLQQYQQDWLKSMTTLNRDFSTNQDAVTKQFEDMRLQQNQRLSDILTAQQLQAWRQTVGSPHAFPPNVYFQPTPANPGK